MGDILIRLDNSKCYSIEKRTVVRDYARYLKSCTNVTKMLNAGHPITIVSPDHELTEEEMKNYRKHYCSKAKEDHMNYIYFECPVIVEEINPMSDTMFEEV